MASRIEKIKHNHVLMMAMCCAIPLVLLAAGVYFFGLSKSYLTWFIFLLCPIMHIFMMRDMHRERKDAISDNEEVHEHDKKGKGAGGCH